MTKEHTHKISVVIPTWIGDIDDIEITVVSLLDQSIPRKDYEIIVVTDVTDQETGKVMRPYTEKYPDFVYFYEIPVNNRTIKRNLGVNKSKSPVILFLDADMETDKRLLEEHLRFHDKYEGSVVGYFNNVSAEDEKVSRKDRHFLEYLEESQDQNLFEGNTGDVVNYKFFYTGNVSLRKSVFERIGGFDERFYPGFGTDPDQAATIYYTAQKEGKPYEFRGVVDSTFYHFYDRGCSKLPGRDAFALNSQQIFKSKWKMTIPEFYNLLNMREEL